MLDIIMLTYNEPNADSNWQRLVDRFRFAQRVDGVKGIREAHHAAACAARTECFYVVDGDNAIDDEFWFDYTPNEHDNRYVHIFRSRNSVNGLVYGNGGIKIFNKSHFDHAIKYIDFSTTVAPSKIHEAVASTTVINATPYQAWRAGFREAMKLKVAALNGNEEALQRLDVWCNKGYNVENGDECIRGAVMGRMYGIANQDRPEKLSRANDFKWLEDLYNVGKWE